MTRAHRLEEPCAAKVACTVLQTSEGSDPLTEFNQPLRRAGLWRRRSFGTQRAAGSQVVERSLPAVTTRRQQQREVLEYLPTACTATLCGQKPPSLLPQARPLTYAS
ncbi:MAG: hypothetical protein HYZ72_10390 [Deltaproteobacteria bacterium]|nr:hypothetical protein [Deltaproteobacteria bacterium]